MLMFSPSISYLEKGPKREALVASKMGWVEDFYVLSGQKAVHRRTGEIAKVFFSGNAEDNDIRSQPTQEQINRFFTAVENFCGENYGIFLLSLSLHRIYLNREEIKASIPDIPALLFFGETVGQYLLAFSVTETVQMN